MSELTNAERRAKGHRFSSPAIERRLDTMLVGGPFNGIKVRMPFVPGSQLSEEHMQQELQLRYRHVVAYRFGVILAKVVGTARYVFMCDTSVGPRHRFDGFVEEQR